MVVFSNFYFGPIAYFSAIASEQNIFLERQENYQKQTYRNRCYILGANGKLRLGIPIEHNKTRIVKDIKISYNNFWQKEHFKSLQSAYQSSPYFEFYEDDLAPIYHKKETYLWDFNLKTLEFINQKLELHIQYQITETYHTKYNLDCRESFPAKTNTTLAQESYNQVFQEKFGFVANLSILDLLCNKGPESSTYIKQFQKTNSL